MTAGISTLVLAAVPFVWVGAVLAISFLETPLKFRAPGITVALGLGIGRLVFRALNTVEAALALALSAAMLAAGVVTGWKGILIVALWVVLVSQVGVLRPRLDRRARRVVTGESPPRSRLHLVYISLEMAKVVLLASLGIQLVAWVAA